MPLQVWLPLQGDLTNNGLMDINVTGGTPVWLNDGKLGKCISLESRVTFNSPNLQSITNNAFSVAFWERTDTSTTLTGNWVDILSFDDLNTEKSGSGVFRFEAGYGSSLRACSWHNNTAYNFTNGSVTVVPDSEKGHWHHICVTIGNGVTSTYRDGELLSASATGVTGGYLQGTFRIGETGAIVGGMNDLRIYDHVLSPKEIKLLSQGLVCHYKLSDKLGLPNMLKCSDVNYVNQQMLIGISNNWSKLSIVNVDGYPAYHYPSAQGPTWFSSGYWYSGGLEANTTYTYSAYIYFTANANLTFNSLGHFQVYNASSTASDKTHEDVVNARIYEPSTITANKWTRIRITFTTNSLSGSYFGVYPRYNIAANTGDLYFRECKLEKGDKPSGWVPHTTDNEYISLGYAENIVYDSSGYNYHGSNVGGVSVSSDTPRNLVSTMYSANTQYSIIQNLHLTGYANSYTFSWWCKFTISSGNKMPWGFANGNRLNLYMYPNNCYWNTGDGADNPFGVALSPYSDGNFHHFAVTGDGTTNKLYIDGEFKGNATTYRAITGTTLIFNGWDTGTNYKFNGCLSDFRIYATALSAEDALALYNTPESIANNGTVITQGEFVEV